MKLDSSSQGTVSKGERHPSIPLIAARLVITWGNKKAFLVLGE